MVLNPCYECGFRGIDPDHCVKHCRKVRAYEIALKKRSSSPAISVALNHDQYADMMYSPALFSAQEVALAGN